MQPNVGAFQCRSPQVTRLGSYRPHPKPPQSASPGTTTLGQRCLYWRRRRRRRRPVPAGASAGSAACSCAARLQAASRAAGGAAARCATVRPAIEHGTSIAPPPSREPQPREDATCATSASGVPYSHLPPPLSQLTTAPRAARNATADANQDRIYHI